MGSSGYGKFGNYKENSNNSSEDSESFIGEGGVKCPIILPTIRLEDVQTSEYFKERQNLPYIDNSVHLSKELFFGRLVVVDTDSNLIIGNLPTFYNYLINCIEQNDYIGSIVSTGMEPIPFVVVDLHV